MKNPIMLVISLTLLFLLVACGDETSVYVEQVNPDKMIHYSEIDSFQEIASETDNFVIFFNSGDTIPLTITLHNKYIEAKENTVEIVAKRTIYFMIRDLEALPQSQVYHVSQNSTMFISFDAVRWAPIRDMNGFREIAGIRGENVTFGFKVSDKQGVTSQLVIDSY